MTCSKEDKDFETSKRETDAAMSFIQLQLQKTYDDKHYRKQLYECPSC